jgi:hypothetical protein
VAEQDAMIHDSQGRIADRTREHLTASDVAIVRFRRAVLTGARALRDGTEPQAPWRASAYRLRSGSWICPRDTPFEQVMLERFRHRHGWVDPGAHGTPDVTGATVSTTPAPDCPGKTVA